MRIELQKFGNILTSRPAGKDAWASAVAYMLPDLKPGEGIEVDFTNVAVLSPSWADEFLTPLKKGYPGRVKLLSTDNPTVKATLEIIETQHKE